MRKVYKRLRAHTPWRWKKIGMWMTGLSAALSATTLALSQSTFHTIIVKYSWMEISFVLAFAIGNLITYLAEEKK